MHRLSMLGLELSITGGILPECESLFKDFKVKAFMAGRALASENGVADAFHEEFKQYW